MYKITPWIIARTTRAMTAPVVGYFSFWQAYWETIDCVMWPKGKKND